MSSLTHFKQLSNLTDYLTFFEIECEETVVHTKRFHILRLFGEQVAKVEQLGITDETRLIDIYRFALISIVKRFEEGYAPSAAEIWGMMDKPGGCLACASQVGCNTDQNGCATTPTIDFSPPPAPQDASLSRDSVQNVGAAGSAGLGAESHPYPAPHGASFSGHSGPSVGAGGSASSDGNKNE